MGSTPILCTDCKTKISKGSKRCVPCDHADRKNNRYTQPEKRSDGMIQITHTLVAEWILAADFKG